RVVVGERLIEIALHKVRVAAMDVGVGVVRRQLDGAVIVGQGAVDVVHAVLKGVAAIFVEKRVIADADGGGVVGDGVGLVMQAVLIDIVAIVDRLCIIGIDPNGVVIIAERIVELPERVARIAAPIIDLGMLKAVR